MNEGADITLNEDDWARVGSYPDAETAYEHALVVLAMGLPCWIEAYPDSPSHDLLVDSQVSHQVGLELREYAQELETQRSQPVIDHGAFAHSPGWGVYFLWVVILLLVHRFQVERPEIVDYGASSSIALVEGFELWRPFTALFLHADMDHLVGNLLSGAFFTTLVACSIGAWRGWALVLFCGVLGNTATSIMMHPEYYTSIGASTAVFAALGILSGLGAAWMLRFRSQVPWLRIVAPLLGGIVVLGMTGSGAPDSNTDVLGHVFGFAAGVIAGIITGCLVSYKASSGTSTAESDART